jgi:hypothetical protein
MLKRRFVDLHVARLSATRTSLVLQIHWTFLQGGHLSSDCFLGKGVFWEFWEVLGRVVFLRPD